MAVKHAENKVVTVEENKATDDELEPVVPVALASSLAATFAARRAARLARESK